MGEGYPVVLVPYNAARCVLCSCGPALPLCSGLCAIPDSLSTTAHLCSLLRRSTFLGSAFTGFLLACWFHTQHDGFPHVCNLSIRQLDWSIFNFHSAEMRSIDTGHGFEASGLNAIKKWDVTRGRSGRKCTRYPKECQGSRWKMYCGWVQGVECMVAGYKEPWECCGARSGVGEQRGEWCGPAGREWVYIGPVQLGKWGQK